MATFTGNKIKDTYQSIVKAVDNDLVGSTDKQLTDGVGNELGIHVNTSGNLRVEGDLRVDGAIKDSLNSPGTSGQLLKSTVTGTDWIDVSDCAVKSLTGGTGIDADASQGDVTISINNEDVQDLIGAMVSGNTETNITVTYDDTNGKLNFEVSSLGDTYTADETTLNLDGSNQFNIANGGVGTTQLASDSVTDDKIAADQVGASELKVTGNGNALQALVSDGDGTFSWLDVVRSIATDSILAADVSTGAVTISLTNNSIGADQLDVSGYGTSGQFLKSDGDGSFSWDDVTGGGGTTNVNLEITRFNSTADGTDTTYTLPSSISDENDIQVFFDGVYQSKDNFSVSGTTLDFGTGNEVESGVEIEVIIFSATSVTLVGGSGSTNFLPIFTTSTEIGSSGVSQANNVLDVDLTGAVTIPVGTTVQRPSSPEVGMFRYNSTLSKYEVYNGSSFIELGNTYTAGNGIALDGSNEFTVSAGSGLTQETNGLAHNDTSSQASLSASSRTYVTGVTLDTFGHVTGLTTATETVTDTTFTATGNGLDLASTVFSHANTSSLSNTSNSGRTYIQNVTVDEFGHLTGVTTATETAGDASTYTAGSGLDLSGSNVFSIESDLRDGISHIGLDSSDYINFVNNTRIDFYVNGSNEMRLESDGDLHVDGDVVAFSSSTSSDERLKDNIKKIESATDKIKQLKGVEFTWKKNGKNGGGVIAQDVEKVLPGAVKEVDSLDGAQTYKAVDYNAVIGLLIETNKELLKRIEKLENKG